jgi:hypothetical protein
MDLCYSRQHIAIPLSATRRYTWERIRDLCKRRGGPFWLRVEGTLVALESEEALRTGCKVCAAYHDWLAYNAPCSDGFDEDVSTGEGVDAPS